MAPELSTVGVIGLGNMGAPVASHVRKAGMTVQAFDVRREVADEVARRHDLIAVHEIDVLAGADAIITVLPTGIQVAEAFDALSSSLRPGMVWIDMSSSDPVHTVALAARAAERGIRLVDAPLSGGVHAAWAGRLTVMVGGEDDAVQCTMPLLRAVGSSVYRTGRLGSGHAMKALNNAVAAAGLVAAGEALAVATRFGVDPRVFVEVINASTGRNVATERKLPDHVLPGRFDSGFALALMVKDVAIACELADHLDARSSVMHRVLDVCDEARSALEPRADHTQVVSWLLSGGARQNTGSAPLTSLVKP